MATKKKAQSSAYINEQRHSYSLYVIQMRALPAATDGLKAGGRRVLWTARDGKKYKSATLAGATMPIHPHASPESAIDTLTAPYGNNIPLFKGDGAFGTLLRPTAYGASRYTAVTVSEFTKDVMFRDIEIIPMRDNYDGTLQEPVHFLPLVPVALLNPTDSIAIGYAAKILPRSLEDIIVAQVAHLKGVKKISEPSPYFAPTDSSAYEYMETDKGITYFFKGEVEIKNTTTLVITSLPYGQTHEAVIARIVALVDSGEVVDYVDRSQSVYNIEVKFRRGVIEKLGEEELLKQLGLISKVAENLNVLDFEGQAVWSPTPLELIREFTDWRLKWYVQRYERLLEIEQHDLQRYYDIRTAIKHKAGQVAVTKQDRSAFKVWLESIGVVHVDYIADLPIYRFTIDEHRRNEQRIADAEAAVKQFQTLLGSEDDRRQVYIKELQEVLTKYNKGVYQ